MTREDIESLGFFDYKHSVGDWYKLKIQRPKACSNYNFRSYRLIHWYKNDYYPYEGVTIIGYEFDWNDDGSEEYLYQGKCKTKEELIHILKQINILDE